MPSWQRAALVVHRSISNVKIILVVLCCLQIVGATPIPSNLYRVPPIPTDLFQIPAVTFRQAELPDQAQDVSVWLRWSPEKNKWEDLPLDIEYWTKSSFVALRAENVLLQDIQTQATIVSDKFDQQLNVNGMPSSKPGFRMVILEDFPEFIFFIPPGSSVKPNLQRHSFLDQTTSQFVTDTNSFRYNILEMDSTEYVPRPKGDGPPTFEQHRFSWSATGSRKYVVKAIGVASRSNNDEFHRINNLERERSVATTQPVLGAESVQEADSQPPTDLSTLDRSSRLSGLPNMLSHQPETFRPEGTGTDTSEVLR